MEWNTLGLLVLLLVCPVAMLLMMRGSHDEHGRQHEHAASGRDPLAGMSEEQLRELMRRVEHELDERHAAERRSDSR